MTSVENKENASEIETIVIIDDTPTSKKENINTFFSPPRKKVKQDPLPFTKLPKNEETPKKCNKDNNTEKDTKQTSDHTVAEDQLTNLSKKRKSPVNKQTLKDDKLVNTAKNISPKASTSPKNLTPAKNGKTQSNSSGSAIKSKSLKPDAAISFPKLSKEDALKESEKEVQSIKLKEQEKNITNDIALPFPKLSKEDALIESEKEIQRLKEKEKEREKELNNDINGVVEGTPNNKTGENGQTPAHKKTPSTGDKKTSPLSKEERQRIKEEKEMQKAARMKEAEEKRKKKEEEKLIKQAEKEKRENERKEKDRLRDEEKRKREDERKLKEEEKQKKDEQLRIEKEKRDAEREKKDLERKLKEEAKRLEEEKKKQDDDALKKKKEKEANHFRSFFTKKKGSVSSPKEPVVESYQRFKPFQVKPDMILAPLIRNNKFNRDLLDNVLDNEIPDICTYLNEQAKTISKNGRPKYISRRKKRRDLEEECKFEAAKKKESLKKERVDKSVENKTIDIEHIVVINDDSNDVDNEDTEDEADLSICDNKYLYIAKLLQFSENTRPSYYGTWRKKSVHISGRKPFALDKDTFNYDIDSDEEWIDEPGENLSDDADEDEKKEDEEKETEDDQDGFFVPHGYLSDDEGIENEADDEDESSEKVTPTGSVDLNEDRKLQLKACSFEQGFQHKLKHRKAICIGITYTHNDENMNPVLRNYMKMVLVKPVHEKQVEEENDDDEVDESGSPQTKPVGENTKNFPLTVPEEAMPLLIRFLHGNVASLPNMIPKFREYWTKYVSENGGNMRSNISKRQLERKIQTISTRVFNSEIGKMCYVVNEDVINMYDLKDLKIGTGLPELTPVENDSSQHGTEITSMEIN